MKSKNNIAPVHATPSGKVSRKPAVSDKPLSAELYKAMLAAAQKLRDGHREFNKKNAELQSLAEQQNCNIRLFDDVMERLVELE